MNDDVAFALDDLLRAVEEHVRNPTDSNQAAVILASNRIRASADAIHHQQAPAPAANAPAPAAQTPPTTHQQNETVSVVHVRAPEPRVRSIPPRPLPARREPSEVYYLQPTEVSQTQADNESQCPSCLEQFRFQEKVVGLDCKHIFHEQCIVPWLRSHNNCPLCQHVLRKRNAAPRSIIEV